MAQPLVTVITVCYNQREFIRTCIDSVRAQTSGAWEQIIVDDGSTDGTADIVAAYDDPRIHLVRLPHRGLAHLADSYNAGLRAGHGRFVAVLEGDDAWPSDKLALQLPSFDDDAVFLSWGRATAIDEQNRELRPLSTMRARSPYLDLPSAEAFARLARCNIFAPAATVMIRREALDAIGGFQQVGSSLYVDLPTWLVLAARTPGCVRFVNRELARYRIHARQTTKLFGRTMDVEHYQIVRAVGQQLDDRARSRLGWDRVAAAVAAGDEIATGRALLAAGDYAAARQAFRRARRHAAPWRDRVKSGLGMLSALLRVDLLGRALAAYSRRLSARPSASVFDERLVKGF